MSDSPIKQPSTCSGEHSFGFDSSNYQPSPWDALAGEDGGTKEPTAGRHGPAGAPTASQAAASNTSNTLTMRELFAAVAAAKQTESPPSPPAQDETYAIEIRPLLPNPDNTLNEIRTALCQIGLDPYETMRWGFKFRKPVEQEMPFQNEAWKRVALVRKLEEW